MHPLSDTEFNFTPFDISPTHPPPPPLPHIPSDSDPILLRNINQALQRKSFLIPTSLEHCHRHSQLKSSLPSPKPLTIPVLEPIDNLSEKYKYSL